MQPGFAIGPLYIHYYGVIIMLGALMAAWLASKLAVKYGQNPDMVWDALPWILITGIIGARLWHVLTPPASMQARGWSSNYYFSHPLDALAIWNGGLGIPGAIMGGALALYLYCRKTKVNFGTFVDILAPGLALGQAIGRWGNFVNQELYGAPSTLPWAITIDPAYRLSQYQDVATYHPLFLYESIWNLLNMGLLLWLGKKFSEILKPGDIMLTYLIVYPLGRFMLEFLRLDPSPVAGLNINQTLMGITALTASIALLIRLSKRPLNVETAADSGDEQQNAVQDAGEEH
ncbi:prolipoprotein diacylglyceryl transferase [Leptolinea sp. HRD-7]|nr:prolipoprotein diacylglyceryl transferase [Leptolinea sp. HRD-7]